MTDYSKALQGFHNDSRNVMIYLASVPKRCHFDAPPYMRSVYHVPTPRGMAKIALMIVQFLDPQKDI